MAAANGVGGKDSAVVRVNVCGGTSKTGVVCSEAPVASIMAGCTEGVVGVDMAIDTGMDDDEKGFELVEKAVPFTLVVGDDKT